MPLRYDLLLHCFTLFFPASFSEQDGRCSRIEQLLDILILIIELAAWALFTEHHLKVSKEYIIIHSLMAFSTVPG